MDKFVIHRQVLGTDLDLQFESGNLTWIDSPDDWTLRGSITNQKKSIDLLLKLNNIDFDHQPPQQFVKMMSCLMGELPPWKKLLTKEQYQEFAKRLITELSALNVSYEYYDYFEKGSQILDQLQPSLIDEKKLNEHIALRDHPSLRTFTIPVTKQPIYNRFGSRTGRLVVEKGPNIISLRRDCRDIFKSRFKGGKIVMIDFNALEIRALLYEAGETSSSQDLYSEFNASLFKSLLSRELVKSCVINLSYGQSVKTLSQTLELSYDKTKLLVERISNILKLQQLAQRLKAEYVKNGHIKNRYGRIIQIEDPSDGSLINSYAQSTGVDVSLLGFSSLMNSLSSPEIIPMFVLMDALIVDVSPSMLDVVLKKTSIKIDGYDQNWYFKHSVLNN